MREDGVREAGGREPQTLRADAQEGEAAQQSLAAGGVLGDLVWCCIAQSAALEKQRQGRSLEHEASVGDGIRLGFQRRKRNQGSMLLL